MLRQFAALWLVFFAGLAGWESWHGRSVLALAFALLAVTVAPMGLLAPRAIRPLFIAWMALAFPIGWTISKVCLAIMFYGVFTPVALVFRLLGRDALALRRSSEQITYWLPKPAATNAAGYLRQF
jgi:hypothetical protein